MLPLQNIPVIVTTDEPMAYPIHTNLREMRTALPAVAWGTLAWGRLSRHLQTAIQVLTKCSAPSCVLAAATSAVPGSHDDDFRLSKGVVHMWCTETDLMSLPNMMQDTVVRVLACTYHVPLFLTAYSVAFDDSLPLRLQRFDIVRETLLKAVQAALAAVMQDCAGMISMVGAAVAAQSPRCRVMLHTGLTCKAPIRKLSSSTVTLCSTKQAQFLICAESSKSCLQVDRQLDMITLVRLGTHVNWPDLHRLVVGAIIRWGDGSVTGICWWRQCLQRA